MQDGDPVKIEFDIIGTTLMRPKGSHPNVQIVVENWGKKIPKIRMFDLRFWGDAGEPGYAIRLNREMMQQLAVMVNQALLVPHNKIEKPRPWWKFWVRR